ncbi:MAG TPA: hypothetical protein VI386_32340 [Candidatus Sulfotelmatobacter sp.]
MNKRRVEKRKTSRKPYYDVHGKVVDWVEHKFEEGLLFIDIRFVDKTALSWSIGTEIVIQDAHLSDWKTGDSKLLKRFVQNKSGCA